MADIRLTKLKMQEYHAAELPVAQLMTFTANMNKDPKKGKPYSMKDFTLFAEATEEDKPNSRFGSAALHLIKMGLFPTWGLFCFSELTADASEDYRPKHLAWISEDAIMLHPVINADGLTYHGMLIAREAAGGRWITFESEDGRTIELKVPPIHTKIIAEENGVLQIEGR